MREIFVTDLVKNILGPAGGIAEKITFNPVGMYITGMLRPSKREIISDVDNVESNAEGFEMQHDDDDDETHAPRGPLNVLDPRVLPSTMGLSFSLESPVTPKIRICATWARYAHIEKAEWQREPHHSILDMNLNHDRIFWLDTNGGECSREKAETSIHVTIKSYENNRYFVSIHLVNRIIPVSADKSAAQEHIFQPQIRVKIVGSEQARIVPPNTVLTDQADRKMEFLYRNRPFLARGHLTSAVWKEIDSEGDYGGKLDFPSCRRDLGFSWPDGELLEEKERLFFTRPDVRTDYMPIYSVPSPRFDWQHDEKFRLQLAASYYAEAWDPVKLRRSLEPLVGAYEKWIHDLASSSSDLDAGQIPVAEEILDGPKHALERIKMGIDRICDDEDSRLAFCFANKAIDEQARWKNGKGLTYRPFQLAFILMSLESILNPQSSHRDVCDLLWVPTGAGKTEAYLTLVALVISYRRIRALHSTIGEPTGAGISVITRYTLRLLSIQQFRRTLSLIVACEKLRITGLNSGKKIGWRPDGCARDEDFLWGSTPFSAGLWVGGTVTPNRLSAHKGTNLRRGAVNILKEGNKGGDEGDPAQILECPACGSILAVPEMGLRAKKLHSLYYVVRSDAADITDKVSKFNHTSIGQIVIDGISSHKHASDGYFTLIVGVKSGVPIKPRSLKEFWEKLHDLLHEYDVKVELVPASPSRLGYFLRSYIDRKNSSKEYDFDIFCPSPHCPLHLPWCGGSPMGSVCGEIPHPADLDESIGKIRLPDKNHLKDVQRAFGTCKYLSDRIPISAYTVDDQIYRCAPSIVVSTVDKFARLPFEPQSSSIFGNVDHHNHVTGYYRLLDDHLAPVGQNPHNYTKIRLLRTPDLIIQDELHLIEGPLGSLVGMYETAVDHLCSTTKARPKYIASTATIRHPTDHIRAVFDRDLQLFPPLGLTSDDRFFINEYESHPLDDMQPGRLYLGVCAPGRGVVTSRLWARMVQTAHEHRDHEDIDAFWTMTGYFNTINDLAGTKALYRQVIPDQIKHLSNDPRSIHDENSLELSSRTASTDLPSILDRLSEEPIPGQTPTSPDGLFTTSMFGTGVDVPRIGLMIVIGQPKTISSYIQSTGRVGRKRGALVVTLFQASRPRDLNHYEFFCRHHRQLHRSVESTTAYPFAQGVMERASGPVAVSILRNMRRPAVAWGRSDTATLMDENIKNKEVAALPYIFERRAKTQPPARRPSSSEVYKSIISKLERWAEASAEHNDLRYLEYFTANYPVVLGDALHRYVSKAVYPDAPNSLRDIEDETGFET